MVGATNQSVYLNFGDTDDDNIGAVYYDNPNDRMIIRANTNNAVQVKSNGNMAINDGDLEIGTSGHGISFAATGDATGMSNELLDDYEEGPHLLLHFLQVVVVQLLQVVTFKPLVFMLR